MKCVLCSRGSAPGPPALGGGGSLGVPSLLGPRGQTPRSFVTSHEAGALVGTPPAAGPATPPTGFLTPLAALSPVRSLPPAVLPLSPPPPMLIPLLSTPRVQPMPAPPAAVRMFKFMCQPCVFMQAERGCCN